MSTVTMIAPLGMPWQSSHSKDVVNFAEHGYKRPCAGQGRPGLKRRNSKRSLHFAATTTEHCVSRNYASDSDKALLWWSPQELSDLQCSGASEQDLLAAAESLQQLWDQSTKTAARRGARGLAGLPCWKEPLVTMSSIDDDDDDDDDENENENEETLRGLETSLICHTIHSSRVAMRQGILHAQKECHLAHPAMKVRILARTAAHLSRASQQFALALAQADAKAVASSQ
jgi:hypothetical protein